MNTHSRKKGYALSMLMIALLVISLGIVALIPVLSIKKDTVTNTSAYVKKCIVDENAASMSTIACTGALTGLTKSFNKDYESLLYYLNDATYKTAALNVVKASCDQGGSKACNILLDRCAANSDSFPNTCDIADSDNDLNYYITMASSDSSSIGYLGKDYLKTKGAEYYLQRMTNFNTAVKTVCNSDMTKAACDIAAETKTNIYNLNSSQRSDFTESLPITGTQFHDGIIDLAIGATGIEWINQYGGAGLPDAGYSIVASGGFVYVTGTEQSDASTGSFWRDAFVMKLNPADGTVIWKKRYGGYYYEYGYSMVIPGDGYIYIAGSTSSSTEGSSDVLLMKLNMDGVQQWAKHYGGLSGEVARAMVISDGNVYIAGYRQDVGNNDLDVIAMKINSDGTIAWSKRWGSAGWDRGLGIEILDGYVYISGHESISGLGGYQLFIIKIKEDGTIDGSSWEKHWGNGIYASNLGYSLKAYNGHIYVTGAVYPFAAILLMKLNPDGTVDWKKKWGNSSGDVGRSITIPGDGYIYVTGSYSFSTHDDLLVLKYDENGNPLLKRRFGGAAQEFGHSIAVAGGYIYVAGEEESDSDGVYNDILVQKLSTNFADNVSGWPEPSLWTYESADIASGWAIDGADLVATEWTTTKNGATLHDVVPANWPRTGLAIADGVGAWTMEGTILDTEVIDAWTIGLNTNSAYVTTTNNNQITGIVGGIKSCSISASEPVNTVIRGLVSFDGRSNWKKWDGNSWVQAATSAQLANYNFVGSGNTTAEIQTGLTNLSIGTITGQTNKLDFLFYLRTDSSGLTTPSLDTVTVTYLKER